MNSFLVLFSIFMILIIVFAFALAKISHESENVGDDE